MSRAVGISHDYGLAGLPLVPTDAEIYPVVVNDLSFDQKEIARNPPEMQMARMLGAVSISGAELDRVDNLMRIQSKNRSKANFDFYYASGIPKVEDASAFLMCYAQDTGASGPSSCDGSLASPSLSALMHIRFPKYKINSTQAIIEKIINKITSWKQN